MADFKKMEDPRYINTLFASLSRQKEIPVSVFYHNQSTVARLLIDSINKQKISIWPAEVLPFAPGELVKISFFYKEIFFIFEAEIAETAASWFRVNQPASVLASYRRLVERYKPRNREEVSIGLHRRDVKLNLVDISTKGLAFQTAAKLFEAGDTARNISISFTDGLSVRLDGAIKHISQDENGLFLYGVEIISIERQDFQKLFTHIFENTYPYFHLMEAFSGEQIYKLYEQARFLNLKPRNEEDSTFADIVENLEQVKDKSLIASNLVYQKNGKLIAIGSVLRIYNRTFLGKSLAMLPQVRLNPKNKTNIYIGLADYLLNHPYFENYLSYVDTDYEWHQDVLTSAAQIIDDRNKFCFENILCYQYNPAKVAQSDYFKAENQAAASYFCETIDKPGLLFYDFCRENMSPLEMECFGYTETYFKLDELSQVYQAYGFFLTRKLWRIFQGHEIVAYAVVECFSNPLSRYSHLDSCKIFPVDRSVDIREIIRTIGPELEVFYSLYEKDSFELIIKNDSISAESDSVDLPGFEFKGQMGLLMANRDGLAEYKQLLLANFEYYSKYFPLTHPQMGIWYLEQMYPGVGIGNIAGTVKFKDRIHYAFLNKAINKVIEENEGLRLRINEEQDLPKQYVANIQNQEFDLIDFSLNGIAELYKWDEKQTKIPFALVNSDLFYFAIFKISEEESGFYIKMHHTISDAWTMNLIINQIVKYYHGYKNELPVQAEAKPSYKDYILSEEEYKYSLKFEKDREFWHNKFTKMPDIAHLKPRRQNAIDMESRRKSYLTTEGLATRIDNFCKRNEISPNVMFLAVFSIYLNRLTNKEDVVIGTPILNRSNVKEKDTVGMFISTIPVWLKVDKEKDFISYLRDISKEWLLLLKHQRYPYELLLKEFRDKFNSTENLYDVTLSVQNVKLELSEYFDEYSVRWIPYGHQVETLNIHISNRDNEGKYVINFDYLVHLFSISEIDALFNHYINLLCSGMANPAWKISDLEIMSQEEKCRILNEFNNSRSDYPRDKTLYELFEEQVAANPNHTALIYGEKRLSYMELNKKANQLARYLKTKDIKVGDAIGMIVGRSFEMIIGIFGILKAGGTYLPIDPETPEERIQYMLDDSRAKIVLTQPALILNGVITQETVDITDSKLFRGDDANLEMTSKPYDPAYIMYTSGSTGQPKGNLTTHFNISRVVKNTNYIEITCHDTLLQLSNYAFDGSTFDIFGALLNGAKLVLVSKDILQDFKQLVQLIKETEITIFFTTTALFNVLVDTGIDCLTNVHKILFGGERVSFNHVKKAFEFLGENRLIHAYGPTESTVFTTCYPVNEINEILGTIPIGKPIANTQVYICDQNHLQPVGFPGELCISGDGLALGYLNRSDLTKEKFIDNPFIANQKMYRTGDLACWLPDGNVQFLGRIDNQVKIRGFRIEFEEIEAHLLKHEAIIRAAVQVWEDEKNNKHLCAYFVANQPVEISDIKSLLARDLPDYMIPSFFIELETLPLSSNGKIDRKALPMPDRNLLNKSEYVAPQNEIEVKLSKIWSDELALDTIGTNEYFFELGGDSLNAISIAYKIHKVFDLEISTSDILKYSTIKELAGYIQQSQRRQYEAISPVERRQYYPVSSAQLRMFLISHNEGVGITYNIPFVVSIKGKLNRIKLEGALKEIVNRHESFRTVFEFVDGSVFQKILDEIDFSIHYLKVRIEELFQTIKQLLKPFSLDRPPLFNIWILELAEDDYCLLFDMHHIIADGTSLNILLEELVELYEGRKLPDLELQYKDFAVWQNQILLEDKLEKQKQYWSEVLTGEIPLLNMPLDYPRKEKKSFNGNILNHVIPHDIVDRITNLVKAENSTINVFLFSIFTIILNRYTGQNDIVVGSIVAGRNLDVKNIIGVFNNFLPIRVQIDTQESFISLMKKVQECVINSLANQDYPYEKMIELAETKNNRSRNPLFDAMLVYHNELFNMIRKTADFDLSIFEMGLNTSKLDFKLDVYPGYNKELHLVLEYCVDLFNKLTMERFTQHFINVINEVLKVPDLKISEINMLTQQEKEQIISAFNDTKTDYPDTKTIMDLFEEQVTKTPGNTAIIFENKRLTYQMLNEKSNQLARILREKGVKADSIVGLMMERSLEMAIGIFGIIKAGGAYLPIDPKLPRERISFILENSNAALLVTGFNCLDCGDIRFNGQTINLYDQTLYQGDVSNLERINHSRNLAYVIYTSGSTGQPKGVMIEHHSVVNRLLWMQKKYPIQSDDVILQKTPFTFDVSVWEIFWWSVLGAGMCFLIPGGEKDPEIIFQTIAQHKISIMHFVPSMLNAFLDYLTLNKDSLKKISSLRQVFASGEALGTQQVNLFNQLLFQANGTKLTNLYGPTEATVDVSYFDCSNCEQFSSIPIGKPIDNIELFIVNQSNRLQPIGVPGELIISGVGLARGYLNRPDLTREKFVAHPLNPDKIAYKTGDLAKWLDDGNIEYLGRIDQQVKIRGFRIELGEIEFQILKYSAIKEAIVIAKENQKKDKNLYAFIVSNENINIPGLRNHLLKALPDYMVPSYFIQVNEIPLLGNGKANRKALLNLEVSLNDAEYFGPRSEVERILCEVWGNVLNLKQVGINDDFFEIGGDSLDILKVLTLVYNYNWSITIQDFYNYKTIKDLAEQIEARTDDRTQGTNPDAVLKEDQPSEGTTFTGEKTEVKNVLLTGATGFLGSHLLNDLLQNSCANVYCLIRKKGKQDCQKRLLEILNFYFPGTYDTSVFNRVFIVEGDASVVNFSLEESVYNQLGEKIDQLFHSAALVRYYGNYSEFHAINVISTEEMVRFCKRYHCKLNHISTMSVSSAFATETQGKPRKFSENDFYANPIHIENVYIRSKIEAENLVLKSIEEGLDATIFRIGNITERYSDGQFQKNIEDNQFHNILKSIMEIGCVPGFLLDKKFELSPVDYCAQAILEIFNLEESSGKTYHIFNPNKITLGDLFPIFKKEGVKIQISPNRSLKDFFDFVLKNRNANINEIMFMVNGLNDNVILENELIDENADFSLRVLDSIGYKWPILSQQYLAKIIRNIAQKSNLSNVQKIVG